MASNSSFDVVSEFDRQELVNAIDQVSRDVGSRYDLKDTKTTVELGEDTITINADSEFTLQAVQTILREKAAKRKLSQKIFDFGKVEPAGGNRVRQVVTLRKGLTSEVAKQISKLIRDEFKKVQAAIQGDAVR